MNSRQITPEIAIAGQPTEADLEALKAEGYAGVVNLRNDGEPDQPLSTAAEGERVRALGMKYLHYGVGGDPFSESGVESVRKFLDEHEGRKVLVHCRSGGRAGAVVLLHRALAEKWSPAEAAEKGKALGLDVQGGLRIKVEGYLHDHQPNP